MGEANFPWIYAMLFGSVALAAVAGWMAWPTLKSVLRPVAIGCMVIAVLALLRGCVVEKQILERVHGAGAG